MLCHIQCLGVHIKQLLVNRGAKTTKIKGKKLDLIKLLQQKYNVKLDVPFSTLSMKSIRIELKLHGGKCRQSVLKDRLIQVLENTINLHIRDKVE